MQASLFDGDDTLDAEPVLMALHEEYYQLIWQGLKRHEFRRRFLSGRATTWYVYLNAPVSRLGAVIDLGPAVVDTPEVVAAIAEQARPGNGASVLEYVRDLEQAYAIPILRVREYAGVSAEELRAELGAWHPPQGYLRLRNPANLDLLRICEKVTSGAPLREMSIQHP
ncbi:hypothetical protein DQ384_39570 [Sphaerisporangium album]|uniref:ASCH domain-containing protein n=1 Tax=Sphaerisporangium album TaxID=509200 RepID=A0A367EK94_9ACTN|nr:hypothetical protein [Sphaerisporangium album]RCG17797.1 hypothetical protein DQ384_39570 [Sphaerisporangium album]